MTRSCPCESKITLSPFFPGLGQVLATFWLTIFMPRVLAAYLCDKFDVTVKLKVRATGR